MLKWAVTFSIEDFAVKTNFHFSDQKQLEANQSVTQSNASSSLNSKMSHLTVTNKTICFLLKLSHQKEQT